MARPLRLLVYDATGRDPLRLAWRTGAVLYRGLRAIDASHGARSWSDALAWLATVHPARPIGEIQFWGHGKWGTALVGADTLDIASTVAGHPLHDDLLRVRERLTGRDALWWWRTCETFGARDGHAFAMAWTRFLDCRSAGHTYVIGAWQSGLHVLSPGETPTWSADEALDAGTPEQPITARSSHRTAPSTITCLTTRLSTRPAR